MAANGGDLKVYHLVNKTSASYIPFCRNGTLKNLDFAARVFIHYVLACWNVTSSQLSANSLV